ncbi:hypothetical protein [Herbaspirillum sp.]|uniref:hypothetical protein n=1 Tax=Herbaspirillum sp. TaxID=1890675 RepID=UPI0031DCC51A
MGCIDAIMQYSIYAALVLCMGGLVASIVLFIALERRWQEGGNGAVDDLPGRFHAPPWQAHLPPHPWEELRNRIGEMQIVADESERPGPYKNVT